MKKITLTCLFAGMISFVQAQTVQTDTITRKMGIKGDNELKINMLMSVLGAPEISYERILDDDMSVGLSVLVGADKSTLDYNFAFTPYYRLYFGAKKASGFFLEANASVASLTDNYYYYHEGQYRRSDNEVNFGLGVAAGAKFLTKKGWIGEFYSGIGRYFGEKSHEAYPRVGITIGKRF